MKKKTLAIMAKKKRQGHYCRICCEVKSNEKFTGKGHAAHICKSCQSLSVIQRNELRYINRVMGIFLKPFISKDDRSLLKKYAKDDRYPKLKEYAGNILAGLDNHQNFTNQDKGEEMIYEEDIDLLPFFDSDRYE